MNKPANHKDAKEEKAPAATEGAEKTPPVEEGVKKEAAPKSVTLSSEEYDLLNEKAKKADEHWDKILRLNADFENSKKRIEKQSLEHMQFANGKLVSEILPVLDDLHLAMDHFEKDHDAAKIKEGVEIALNKFNKVLKDCGVKTIDALGKPFDPHFHEAMGEVETDKTEEGHVADEFQKGYLLHGRLIRPSRVRIAKKH